MDMVHPERTRWVNEIAYINRLLASGESEFLAVYGRRRVGKTFLIREIYRDAICFELVGLHGVDVSRQLRAFADDARAVARGHGVTARRGDSATG